MNRGNDQLSQAILATLRAPSEPWFPELTEALVARGWEALRNSHGILPATYSTASIMQRDQVLTSIDELAKVSTGGQDCFAKIEFLSPEVQKPFSSDDYKFITPFEFSNASVEDCLSLAFELIGLVPSLRQSVVRLVRSIHIIRSNAANCDISFSDPALPFSIFVSAPNKNSPNAALRLAEAIVHESMHLQLALLEVFFPIALAQTPVHYSPWKQSFRSASGLLHALFVFTIIDEWFAQLPHGCRSYVDARRTEIAEQVQEIEMFRHTELTIVGDMLRQYLFSKHRFA